MGAAAFLVDVKLRFDQGGASNHVLQAFLLDLLHVSLVAQKLPEVLDHRDVLPPGLMELVSVLNDKLIFAFDLRIVLTCVLMIWHFRLLREFNVLISVLNLFEKLLFGNDFDVLQVRAASDLVQAVALAWELGHELLH